MSTDTITFFDEVDGNDSGATSAAPWKILVVDDEEEVFNVTQLAISGYEVFGKQCRLLYAPNSKEACKVLDGNPDIALVLLDIVMETDTAGINVIEYIRKRLNNPIMRIVIRTGQPGVIPEENMLREYDIDDYREKTELTAQKLRTLIRSNIHSFMDMTQVNRQNIALTDIVNFSKVLLTAQTRDSFEAAIYRKLNEIGLPAWSLSGYMNVSAYSYRGNKYDSGITVTDFATKQPYDHDDITKVIFESISGRQALIYKGTSCYICLNMSEQEIYGMVFRLDPIDEVKMRGDSRMLDLLIECITINYRNLRLRELIDRNQREIIYRLSEVVETRSKETGLHVKRVSLYCELIAKLLGLPKGEQDMLKRAAPLHDIGKIGIPDRILNKPGKLDPDEWAIMKTHSKIGYDMLKDSDLQLFRTAGIIAYYHHEKWDGSGYPLGLKGEEIPLYGRIAALADVFDALGSDRCYKKAWPLDKIIKLIREESGHHFDPKIVKVFLEHLDEFIKIRDMQQDQFTEGNSVLSENSCPTKPKG